MSTKAAAARRSKSRAPKSVPLDYSILIPAKDEVEALPGVIAEINEVPGNSGHDIVVAERVGRTDFGFTKFCSRIANGAWPRLLGDKTHDTANGLKAARRSDYLAMPHFDTRHRFIPALVARGGGSIGHIDVTDRPRLAGQFKYGIWDRPKAGISDLFVVWWLKKRRKINPSSRELKT